MFPPEEFFSSEFLSAHGARDSFPGGAIVRLEACTGAVHAFPRSVARRNIFAAYGALFHKNGIRMQAMRGKNKQRA